MTRVVRTWSTLVGLLAGALLLPAASARDLLTVDGFDLERYVGTWYQIALLPNKFQAACADSTTAKYNRDDDGGIVVVNRCRDHDGNMMQATGKARINDRFDDPARLQVRFAPAWLAWLPWVWGDYWVLAIDPAYTAALVGAPDRRFLWILARRPSLPVEHYTRLVGIAKENGYDVSALKREPGTVLLESGSDATPDR